MNVFAKKKRLRLRSILLIVNLVVLLLPLGSIVFFRFYENQLVHQTELELISQGAVLSSVFLHELKSSGIDEDYGAKIVEAEREDPYFRPVEKTIDLSESLVLPRRPDGKKPEGAVDPVASKFGPKLTAIAKEAQRTTLSGIKILDYQGITIAGQSEIGDSFAHLIEIQSALLGQYSSVIRQRISDEPPPALSSLSRGTGIRVFVAFPVVENDRLFGVVYLSRTPQNILRHLYGARDSVITVGLLVLCLTLALGLFISRTISRPIHRLIERIRLAQSGDVQDMQPIDAPITEEVALLSQNFSDMALSLHSRSEYIRQFASHVSHEFKTPLTSIQGAAELLSDHYSNMSTQEREKFIGNIIQDTSRLEKLVKRLLELAKADNLVPSNQSCTTEVIFSLIDRYATKGLQIEVTPVDAGIQVSKEYMETVFINLFDNSCQHGASKVQVTLSEQDDHLDVILLDDGEGISEANRNKVFEPFFTTKRDSGGTGLGLDIIRSILQAHGGEVSLGESSKGTQFKLKLPLLASL